MTHADAEADADGIADARLAAIVDSSFDAIISKDLNSVITSWNRAAEKLFGYTAEEAIGQSVVMLIPEGLRDQETEIIARLTRGESIESFETIRQHRDGHLLDVSLTISPIRDKRGRIIGASKIARDIGRAKDSERRIRMLMREVNHRVKNQYAVILSIIRETSKRVRSPSDFEAVVRDRIMGLSRSHDLLVNDDWRGASMEELAHHQLVPYGNEERVEVAGPAITLLPTAVQNIGMAFHELATNSAKYGVLARDAGRISITWQYASDPDDEPMLRLVWEETVLPGETVDTSGSERGGFGMVVLKRVAPLSLNGRAEYTHDEEHLRWTLIVPLASAIAGPGGTDDDG